MSCLFFVCLFVCVVHTLFHYRIFDKGGGGGGVIFFFGGGGGGEGGYFKDVFVFGTIHFWKYYCVTENL